MEDGMEIPYKTRNKTTIWPSNSTPRHIPLLMLLLLRCFSRVWLCATLIDGSPLSLGFSRQEHWSGLHFLLQCMKVKSESEVAQSCPTLSDPMDCSLPGSSVHGIFQARVLEWGAFAFGSQNWKRHMYPIVHWSTFYNSWNMEAT